jgi:hypothetical protein
MTTYRITTYVCPVCGTWSGGMRRVMETPFANEAERIRRRGLLAEVDLAGERLYCPCGMQNSWLTMKAVEETVETESQCGEW